MLDNTIPPEKYPDYLKIIKGESQRLITLSNSLIELNRIDSNVLEKEAFDVNSLLLNVLDAFEQRLLDKNMQVDVKLTCEKCQAYGNKAQIERVIHNLIDNAIKFAYEDSTLTLAIESLSNRKYKIIVNNQGDIIPSEQLNKIWEKFYKEDSSRNHCKLGYGIGLSIVKEILINHEEEVFVESNAKNGTTFSFTLAKLQS